MASADTLHPSSSDNDYKNTSFSYFQKAVCVIDWWLIKAEKDFEGKRLAVAGLTSRGKQARRMFFSAPILKRYGIFTLETTDGMFVILKGVMNKARTKENGFPSEVFNHFVFGFPSDWEQLVKDCLGEGLYSLKSNEKDIKVCRRILNLLDAGPEEPTDILKVRNLDTGCVRDGSQQNFSFSSSVADPKQDQNHGDTNIQAGTPKNTNEVVQKDIRLGVADDKNCLKTAVGEEERISKEACTTRKKTKWELTHESPVNRREKEMASTVSPESLSTKRSRSGRLLLPTLEFWRNQTAIYNVDRSISGIREGLPAVQPYGGERKIRQPTKATRLSPAAVQNGDRIPDENIERNTCGEEMKLRSATNRRRLTRSTVHKQEEFETTETKKIMEENLSAKYAESDSSGQNVMGRENYVLKDKNMVASSLDAEMDLFPTGERKNLAKKQRSSKKHDIVRKTCSAEIKNSNNTRRLTRSADHLETGNRTMEGIQGLEESKYSEHVKSNLCAGNVTVLESNVLETKKPTSSPLQAEVSLPLTDERETKRKMYGTVKTTKKANGNVGGTYERSQGVKTKSTSLRKHELRSCLGLRFLPRTRSQNKS